MKKLPNPIGESPVFLELLDHLSRVAKIDRPLLIVGERGTGKELIAARCHYLSNYWQGPFIKINCAALPENLLEAELFGHEAGAFTGATRRRHGRFEQANNGSLFLDELANAAMPVQEKILRVIEYGEFERLGSSETLSVDVRVIAATNQDLPRLGRENKFREDLLDRLAFDVLTLPPLRARGKDIDLLAQHFAQAMAVSLSWSKLPEFSDIVRQDMHDYRWPGNIRELKNVVERAIAHADEDEGLISQLQIDPFASPFRPDLETPVAVENSPLEQVEVWNQDIIFGPLDLKQTLRELEIRYIKNALRRNLYNQKESASFLGLNYHQFRNLLRKYRIAS